MIDIGANLTNKRFHQDIDRVLADAKAAQIKHIIVTGTSKTESIAAQQLAAQYPDFLKSTAGVHPHDAKHWGLDSLNTLRQLAMTTEVVALGECGLDFNRNFSSHAEQEQCFSAQLTLAAELNKPVFLHERDAFPRFAAMLGEQIDHLSGAVVHCFTGTEQALKSYLDMGCYIGITGWICDERRGDDLRRIARYIPADRLMVETDAPYLLPRTIKPKPRGGRNEPAFLGHVVATLAQCRNVTVDALVASTTATAQAFFNLA